MTTPEQPDIHGNRSFHCLNHLLQFSGAYFIIGEVNRTVNVGEVSELHLAFVHSIFF